MATPRTARLDPARMEIPPLRHGDRLSRAEFERRYDAMPGLKKAELIEGVVYMPSPVRVDYHGTPHAHLIGVFFYFKAHTPGTQVADNTSVRLELDCEPQPDGMLFIEPRSGGQVQISADNYVEGGPDLVGEVSGSSKDIDLGLKFQLYQRNNVREYVVWRVEDQAIDWFALREDRFDRFAPGTDGVYRSEALPGLWLDATALIQGDLQKVLQVLQQGIASPDHAAFVARLRQAGPTSAQS